MLVGRIRVEKARAGTTRDDWIAKEMALLISVLQDDRVAVETPTATSDTLAAQSARPCSVPVFGARIRFLRSVPSIGPAVSAILMARLAGLATHATDSGLHRGKRHIRGVSADVRHALTIAAFIASRYDPGPKALRKRLQDAGKPVKLVVTACARKLLTIPNAMKKNAQGYVKIAA